MLASSSPQALSKSDEDKDLMIKQKIIRWMVKNNINKINDVGKLIREYYSDPQSIIDKTGARENA